MKLHLGTKATILSRPPEIPVMYHGGRLYHYSSPYIYVTRVEDGRVVQKLRYEDVGVIRIYAGRLYVCTSNVYILDLETYDILDIVRLSRALIDQLEFGEHDPTGGTFMLSKMSREVLVFEGGRRPTVLSSGSCCDALFIGIGAYGYVDKERLVLYRDRELTLSEPMDELVGVFTANGEVYSLDRAGVLREWISGVERNIGAAEQMGFAGGVLYVSNGYEVCKYGLSGELLGRIDMRGEIERYSGRAVRGVGALDSRVEERIKKTRLRTDGIISRLDVGDAAVAGRGGDENDVPDDTEELHGEQSSVTNGEEQSSIMSGRSGVVDDRPGIYNGEECPGSESSMNGINDPVFNKISANIIQMDNTKYIIHEDFAITKIFSFNNDVTDSLQFGDMLVVATASGSIIYTSLSRYPGGECLFDGRVIQCHDDSITGMARCGSTILTGSRDATAVLWRVHVRDGGRLELREIKRFTQSIEPIGAVAYDCGVIALASLDNILQIYRVGGCAEDGNPVDGPYGGDNPGPQDRFAEENENIRMDEMLCRKAAAPGADAASGSENARGGASDGEQLFFTNILVQQVHSRQINSIAITPRCIITASSDRTAKVFSHAGEHVKTITSDKYLHVSYSSEYIALCGHKTIRVLDRGLGQVAVFQVRKPVLSSCFYGGMLLGTSDVVRVYDVRKGKCVKSYDFGVQNCWSFSFPILCGDTQIALLTDESAEVNAGLAEDLRLEREESMLMGVYCREKNFRRALEIAAKRNDYKKMFRIVCDGYYSEGNLDCLEVLSGCRSKLIEMLLKNPGLKQSEIFNAILRNDPYIVKSDKLYEICRKHSQAIGDIYISLLGLDIYK